MINSVAKPQKVSKHEIMQIFHLKHLAAKDATTTLQQLYADQPTRFVADARINAVIVNGKPDALKEVEALLRVLDAKSDK